MQPIGHADPRRATRPTSSPRPSRSPSTPATSCPASTSPTTRCCRAGCSPTSTPRSPGSAGPNFAQIPINRPHAPVNDMLRDGFHQTRGARGRRAVPAELARRRLPVPRRRRRRRLRRGARTVPAATEGARRPGVVRRPLQPGPAVLAEPDRRSSRSTSSQAYTFELGKCYEQAIKERQLQVPRRRRRRPVRAGRRRARPAGARAHRRRSPTSTPSPALSQLGETLAGRRPDRRHRRRRRPATCRRGRGAAQAAVGSRHGAAGHRAARRRPRPAGPARRPAHLPHGPLGRVRRRAARRLARSRRRTRAGAGRQGRQPHGRSPGVDPRILLLLAEAFRHAKAIGGWGDGAAGLDVAGHPDRRPRDRRRTTRPPCWARWRNCSAGTGSGSVSRPAPSKGRSAKVRAPAGWSGGQAVSGLLRLHPAGVVVPLLLADPADGLQCGRRREGAQAQPQPPLSRGRQPVRVQRELLPVRAHSA